MDVLKGNQAKVLLVAVIIILAAYKFDLVKQIAWNLWSAWHPAPAASAVAPGPSQPSSTPAPDAEAQAESTVKAYMRSNAIPQTTFSFLDWTDFTTSGDTSAISLRYGVEQPSRPAVQAYVRFTIQGGRVVRNEEIPSALPSAPSATHPALAVAPARRLPAPPPVVIDRFTTPIFNAVNGPGMTLELSDAFSLAQLDQAKAKAEAERKPLGFIMVWGQFFDHEAEPRGRGSDSALVHFYEVFNPRLVLVFVRHETELGLVTRAVMAGFRGPDEGGFAPNMAVTDASATEFIVEIPYKDLDGPGRDQLFAEGGRKIDEWMATHPMALPTPANP
jgi:hypothetical protein